MSDLVDRVYEIAYFWRVSPFEIMERPISDLAEMLSQQERLAQLVNGGK